MLSKLQKEIDKRQKERKLINEMLSKRTRTLKKMNLEIDDLESEKIFNSL